MADEFQITCATKSQGPHGQHITSVGVYKKRWSVDMVRRSMDNGTKFYTYADWQSAWVHKYDCACGVKTIRSAPDATPKNNLDNLPTCLEVPDRVRRLAPIAGIAGTGSS